MSALTASRSADCPIQLRSAQESDLLAIYIYMTR
jgi:hypothetical protein